MAADQDGVAPESDGPVAGISALRARKQSGRRTSAVATTTDKAPAESSSGSTSGQSSEVAAADPHVRRVAPQPLHKKAEVSVAEPAAPSTAPTPQGAEVVERPGKAASQTVSQTVSAVSHVASDTEEPRSVPAQGIAGQVSTSGASAQAVNQRPTDVSDQASVSNALVVAAFEKRAPVLSHNAAMWDKHTVPPLGSAPRAEEVLNQRFVTRENLNASVPSKLDVQYRIEVLRVVSGINHIPPADLVAVAVDWFLRGGKPSPDEMLPPWNTYVGPGTDDKLPKAEDVLQERFLDREPLKWQVPEVLQLNRRLNLYRVMNRLTKVPVGDIVTVAIDRWLRVMQY